MDENPKPNRIWQTTVDTSGRVLLPAELRRSMDVAPGSELLWIKDENGVHLTHFETCLAELQAYYQSLSPADVVWSEELIKHRRQEASHE